MSRNQIKGINIEIGGNTKPLDKALGDVNSKTSKLQSELREVEKLLKFDPTNTELITQKQKLLGDAIENTGNKLKALKEAEKQAQKQFEEGKISEEQFRGLQREIVKTEQELNKAEESAKKFGGTLTQELKKAGDKMKDFGGKVSDIGGKMTTMVTLPIVAAGGVAFKFAADLEDAMGASDQIFKESSDEVQKWADSLNSSYGIAEGEALTYANTMGAMLQNIGQLSEEEASKQSQMLVELAGDLTAMFGGTTESAVQALTGALKGNTSMLDNYGMGVNDATIKSKALEMGLMEEGKELSLAGKQAAILALIMDQTSAAQGQAAREADGASGTMRTMTTELKNVAGELGGVLIPLLLPFIQHLKDIIGKFKGLSPEMQETVVKVALIVAAIGPLLLIIGKVSVAISGIMGLMATLSTAAVAAGTTVGAMVLPFAAVVAAIVAVIAIGVLLYKNWDVIKQKATEIFSALGSFIGGIFDGVTGTIKKFIDWVVKAIGKVKEFFTAKNDAESATPLSQSPTAGLRGYINGTHANGLANVPFNGYLAELHRGERVLTAAENKNYGSNSTVNHTGTIRHEGINNKGELVAVIETTMNQIMRRELRTT